MKVYISVDIEGVTGVSHGDETRKDKADYQPFRDQMAAEVAAACRGAFAAGAGEVWVKDAHGSGRNLRPGDLPRGTRLIREWSGSPLNMMQEIQQGFDAALMVGYHSGASSGGNPLSHTYSGSMVEVKLNGRPVSEFVLNALAAAQHGVPVVFLSGDAALCETAKDLIPAITTVAVMEGIGSSTVSIHPEEAVEEIGAGVTRALRGRVSECLPPIPDEFSLEVRSRSHGKAFELGYYPGARQVDPVTVVLESEDYTDILRFFLFAI
ncbi:MAG: M55 family metallopeptidase [Candidatus Bipolaricaulota bacterium]